MEAPAGPDVRGWPARSKYDMDRAQNPYGRRPDSESAEAARGYFSGFPSPHPPERDMANDLADLGLRDAARLVSRRKLSPVDLVEAALARVEAENPRLNAVITVLAEPARAAARRVERAVARGSAGPLAGVPVTIKDLIVTQDAATTLGSRVLPDGLPPAPDAPVVARIRRAGGVVIGKANLHEIALGVTTVNEHFGPARNPWNPERIAGGSSGGSAVAVAAGMGLGSVGTDTRGSIRIPAACCGITGFKPSYGAVSTEGVFPLAATLDHVGPMTRSVEDAAVLFGVMTGSRRRAAAAMAAVDRKPRRRFKLGVAEFFLRDIDPESLRAIEGAVKTLEKLGAEVVSVELPSLEPALEASRVIVLAEAISYHDELLKQHRDGYGPNVRARLEGGYDLTALQYVRAEEVRLELLADYGRLFSEVDCLVGAVLPGVAPSIETQQLTVGSRTVSLAEAFCHFNAPQNMTGAPALSIPCGFGRDGLPIGLQLIAGVGRDEALLGIGAAYQHATDWHRQRPKSGPKSKRP